jgi:hypothetical protein
MLARAAGLGFGPGQPPGFKLRRIERRMDVIWCAR